VVRSAAPTAGGWRIADRAVAPDPKTHLTRRCTTPGSRGDPRARALPSAGIESARRQARPVALDGRAQSTFLGIRFPRVSCAMSRRGDTSLLPPRHARHCRARHGTCVVCVCLEPTEHRAHSGSSARLCAHAMLAIPKAILLESNVPTCFPTIYPTLARRAAACGPWHVRCFSAGAAQGLRTGQQGSRIGLIVRCEKGRAL